MNRVAAVPRIGALVACTVWFNSCGGPVDPPPDETEPLDIRIGDFRGPAHERPDVRRPDPVLEVTGLQVTPAEVHLRPGSAIQLTVLAIHSDDSTTDVTPTATYQVADESVAVMVADGRIQGVADGGTSLVVTFEGVSETVAVVVESLDVSPPSPSGVRRMYDGVSFLFQGDDPVQIGVEEGAVDPRRVAVIRGVVLTPAGDPVAGARVTAHRAPELGETTTGADGGYDLVVNGGGPVVVHFEKAGHLPVQRHHRVPWQDYLVADPVVLTPLDPEVTTVDLTEPGIKVARGGVVEDEDGSRQATVVFPEGRAATVIHADGTEAPIDQLDIRLTEYTVGDAGPEAMPGDLPANVAYTYAVEISADEAIAAGAVGVDFDAPIYLHLENFLDFPVGMAVPTGWYDLQTAQWVASDDGRIIEILGVDGEGRAQIDVTGDGAAADASALEALDVNDEELEVLAGLYDIGATLWRAPVTHLTPWDLNWPFHPPEDARPPGVRGPRQRLSPEEACEQDGSIVYCEAQAIGKSVDLVGTEASLHYRSDQAEGYQAAYTLHIPVSGESLPESLDHIVVRVTVAGRYFAATYPAEPNLEHVFVWDGHDAYGRAVRGAAYANVAVGFVYPGVFREPSPEAQRTFGQMGGTVLTANGTRQEITFWQRSRTTIGGFGLGPAASGPVGGWSLSMHHRYDPVTETLAYGDGRLRRLDGRGLDYAHFAGTGRRRISDDGLEATETDMTPHAVAVAPDGAVYVADATSTTQGDHSHRVRRIDPDGTVTTVAGAGPRGSTGDGVPATEAELFLEYASLAIGPDGSLYIAQRGSPDWQAELNRPIVRRVGPDGVIRTVAGNGSWRFGTAPDGEGGPATAAALGGIADIHVDDDGVLYLVEEHEERSLGHTYLRRVGPDGRITTIATPPLDIVSAMTVSPGGTFYIATPAGFEGEHYIWRIRSDGAFSDSPWLDVAYGAPFDGDGLRVGAVIVRGVTALQATEDTLYVAERPGGFGRIRAIDLRTEFVDTLAGVLVPDYFDPVVRLTFIHALDDISIGPDGGVYAVGNRWVHRLGSGLPGIATVSEHVVASEDGMRLHHFDATGRHLHTFHALTGATLYRFGYDGGLLVEVEDGDGGTTRILRDGGGHPLAIVGPHDARTELGIDAVGFVNEVAHPGGGIETARFDEGGRLVEAVDLRGHTRRYDYDEEGRLVEVVGPTGVPATLAREDWEDGFEVVYTSPLGREATYRVEEVVPDGRQRWTRNDEMGGEWVMTVESDGQRVLSMPDGTMETQTFGPDPRFGRQAPVMVRHTVAMPDHPAFVVETSRAATLEQRDDPFSLVTLSETLSIGGRDYVTAYDPGDRRFTVTSPSGRTQSWSIDAFGRVVERQVGAGLLPITYGHDARGRLVSLQFGPLTWTWTFDASGNLASQVDGLDRTVWYTRDEAGRAVEIASPSGRTHGLVYDGRLRTRVVLPGGAFHDVTYDADGRETALTTPDGATFTRSYDADGSWTGSVLPSGRSVTVEHDAGGRPVRYETSEATTAIEYAGTTDRMSRISRTPEDGGASAQSIRYDYLSSLITEMAFEGAASGLFEYTYDSDLLLAEMRFDGGSPRVFGYDVDRLLTNMGPFAITRDDVGQPVSISDDRLTVDVSYDALGRLIERVHAVDDVEVYRLELEWSDAQQILERHETVDGETEVLTYDYDDDGQIVSVTRDGVIAETYAYDVDANRISAGSTTATYEGTRLTALGDVAYAHDADGYLTERGEDRFRYGTRGELLEAVLEGGPTVGYDYDAWGRLVARRGPQGKTELFYGALDHPFQVTASRAPDGTVTEYHYDEHGHLIALERGGAWYYVATTPEGSPRRIVDDEGASVREIVRNAFGQVISDSDPGFRIEVGFAGGVEDPYTGLVRFGLRDYDPAAGRWTALDPVLLDGRQSNLYVYVQNDPVNRIDPSGLFCIGGSIFAGIGGGGQLCVTREGMSVCGRVGVGAGTGIAVDLLNDDLPQGFQAQAEAGVSAFGVAGVGVGLRLNRCGLKPEFKCKAGNLSCDGSIGHSFKDHEGERRARTHPNHNRGKRFGASAEVTVGYCGTVRW